MELFGMGFAPDNRASDMLGTVGFEQSRGKATLFLFTPRNIPNQCRRPYLYQFGGEFRDALDSTISRSLAQPTNHMTTMMLDAPQARSAIIPSAQGQAMNLSTFSDAWTFLLVIDNDTGVSPLGLTTSMPSRMLYSGWVLGEPVTRRNFSAGYVYNPSAMLVTTHHTTLCVQSVIGMNGTYRQVNTTGDFDYLSGQMAQQFATDNQNLYNLQLGALSSSIIPDTASPSFTVTPPPVAASNKTIEISTDINNPAAHLQKVVGGIVDAVKGAQFPNMGNPIDVFAGGDVLLSNFTTYVNSGSRNVVLSNLPPNEPISMETLEQRYNTSLDVTICEIPKDSTYELSEPFAPTARNVFTSILATSLPPILAQFGLAEVAFRYNSAARPNELFPDPMTRGIFEVLRIGTLYGEDSNQMQHNWDQLERYLRMCIFPIVRENAGEFDLVVHCALGGVSLINLNFLDNQAERGLQENNNLLGGLNTPFLGHMNEYQNNAGQLYTVIKDASSTGGASFDFGAAALMSQGLPTY